MGISDTSEEIEQRDLKGRLKLLESGVRSAERKINSNSEMVQANLENIRAWKTELTQDVESKIRSKIIESGAAEAVKKLSEDQSLVFSAQFKEEIANIISTKYVERLRGPSGVDADNEVIANFLLSDADFLDRVSTGIIIQQ